MSANISKNLDNKAISLPSYFPANESDQVFYNYDCKSDSYKFIAPGVTQLLGYSLGELNEQKFEKLIISEREEFKTKYPLNGNPDGAYIEEKLTIYFVETKNGDNKWIEDKSISIYDSDSNKTTRMGLLRDIGEKLHEEKLKQIILEILEAANSEKNLGELFRFIHSSIKKLMKADNFYIAYYKRDSDLLTFPYFVDEVDNDSSSKKLGKGLTEYVLRTGKSALIDLKKDEALRKKGEIELIGPQSPIWLGIPLKIKEKTIGVLVVQDYADASTYTPAHQQILDVISYPISRAIERKIVEEERKEMIVKLKEMNTSKDRLFSLISHDLRSPFNSLLGFAEILRTDFDNLTHRDIKEYINVINDSSNTLFEMTNNLLHYSRLQLNKYDYIPKKVLLNEVINEATESLKYRIQKKKASIRIELKQNYTLVADEEMLISIFRNIISNALKFSHKQSTINIFAEEALDHVSNALTAQISITDEGIGISEENQILINSGVMFSTQGTEKEPGSGLGLLLTKKYVSINKGKFEIISFDGQGTTVVITFPSLKI
ncbi:MAG: GAF domain-containing sensor histidine kinase [Ignavibacteriaceae bacterium]|nr:GAF domain-containing sensor histidine kinase [Ignavibacteriaceae bacterium]MCU0405662.1 GAF domain-containing sensor histidine kinase [Ignavibacteriaceae bacterium]MCU0413022.1 GAF domain-containing sensor histidine kinase [Ignavibacteriaceae bacterium]